MTKRNLLSTLLLSTLALTLAASVVSADETATVSNPTDVVVTETPQTPVLPTEPVVTETPVTDPGSGGVVIDNPTEPVVTESQPIVTTQVETTSQAVTEATQTSQPETTSQAVTEAKTAEEAKQSGQSQVGTKSTVTGQVVSNVSETEPVQLASGQRVVSTKGGQLILANDDGTQSAVSPETVGAKTNADGTISVKTADNKLKTLPHTGAKESILMVLAGFVLLVMGFSHFFPEQFEKLLAKLKGSDKA